MDPEGRGALHKSGDVVIDSVESWHCLDSRWGGLFLGSGRKRSELRYVVRIKGITSACSGAWGWSASVKRVSL